LKIDI